MLEIAGNTVRLPGTETSRIRKDLSRTIACSLYLIPERLVRLILQRRSPAIRRYHPLNIYESPLTIFNPLGGRWRHSTGKLLPPGGRKWGTRRRKRRKRRTRLDCCIIYHGQNEKKVFRSSDWPARRWKSPARNFIRLVYVRAFSRANYRKLALSSLATRDIHCETTHVLLYFFASSTFPPLKAKKFKR